MSNLTTLSSLDKMQQESNLTSRLTNTTSPPLLNLPLVIILGALIPFILVGNTLVCVAFIKFQRLRNATNCFLFSLAISDLAVGLILIPFWIAFTVNGFSDMPQGFTKVWRILDVTCSVASMTNLASVSIERWYGVTHPFRHLSMSTSHAIVMSSLSWFYAIGTAMFYLVQGEPEWIFTVITILGLCIPFFIMTICYSVIARVVKRKTPGGNHQSGRECKTVRTLILISVIFLVCWFPFILGSLLTNYCHSCAAYVNHRPAMIIFPKVLHYSHSCINPFLYAILSPSFKSAFEQLFRCTRRSRRIQRGRNSSSDNSRTGINTKRFNLTASFKDKRRKSGLEYNQVSLKMNNNFV